VEREDARETDLADAGSVHAKKKKAGCWASRPWQLACDAGCTAHAHAGSLVNGVDHVIEVWSHSIKLATFVYSDQKLGDY
jgi:hypothetical protein